MSMRDMRWFTPLLGPLASNPFVLMVCGLLLVVAALVNISRAIVARDIVAEMQPALAPEHTAQEERVASVLGPEAPAAASPAASPQAPDPAAPAEAEQPVAGERAAPLPSDTSLGPKVAIPHLPPGIPHRIVIPAIDLNAPIIPIKAGLIRVQGQKVLEWDVPNERAAGWHDASARLGEAGNTVLNGHHNTHGEVFSRLVDLEISDQIIVYSLQGVYEYAVVNKMVLPERNQQLETRIENARWILPSKDERLTLVTCWPRNSNTHRLIIVAQPTGQQPIDPNY